MKLVRGLKTNLMTQSFGLKGTKPDMLSFYEGFGLIAHNGWDWLAKKGEPIYWDCVDCHGYVLNTHIDSAGGLGVVIVTEDKDGIFKHLFWHLSAFNCYPGQKLSSGAIIGYAGSTGNSTGPHLHRGLKRAEPSNTEVYKTIDKDNGYNGAINIAPHFQENICIQDIINKAEKELSFIAKQIKAITDWLNRTFPQ